MSGQAHLLGPGQPLSESIRAGKLHSMVLWGPPGVGKTTLAKLIASSSNSHYESISAVLAGVKDIRAAIDRARYQRDQGRQTVLFVDEVHRFNKAQQDAFLPHLESGTIIFIGATTENPAFELNNALLSRARIYVLKPLTKEDLRELLERAIGDKIKGLGMLNIAITDEAKDMLAGAADGDARRLLNLLEMAAELTVSEQADKPVVSSAIVKKVVADRSRRFDKKADIFYEQISALHKSIRGSSPDAALYWLLRMLDAGCDPLYIARRLLRMASEDIGNADPRALQLALNGWDTFTRLGSPEGELALAQVAVYLACAPKSNAVYEGFNAVRELIHNTGSLEVPVHLRNAVTALSKDLGHGQEYRYVFDESDAFAPGENYFPEPLKDAQFYFPKDAGLESRIREKLEQLRELDRSSSKPRYSHSDDQNT